MLAYKHITPSLVYSQEPLSSFKAIYITSTNMKLVLLVSLFTSLALASPCPTSTPSPTPKICNKICGGDDLVCTAGWVRIVPRARALIGLVANKTQSVQKMGVSATRNIEKAVELMSDRDVMRVVRRSEE
jgi:hypothetical protein